MTEFNEVVHRVIDFQVVWGITGRDCVGFTSHAVLPRVGLLKRKTVALLPRATTLGGLPGEEGSSREISGIGEVALKADSVSSAYVVEKREKTMGRSIAIVVFEGGDEGEAEGWQKSENAEAKNLVALSNPHRLKGKPLSLCPATLDTRV